MAAIIECANCGAQHVRTSGTQRVCPPCRPIWKRKLAEARGPYRLADNSNRLTRAECEAILAQLVAVREKACKAETPAEVEFYTRKYDALDSVVRPYVDGWRRFADGTHADVDMMAMG